MVPYGARRLARRATTILLLAAAGCGEGDAPRAPAGWDDEIALPAPVDLSADPATLEIDLDARPGTREFVSGAPAEVWTYGGGTPGPLLRAKVGDRLIVHFDNHLPDPTTIHWHGVRTPNAMDGAEVTHGEHGGIEPGGHFDYDFVLRDAGTYWYHPHVRSYDQVERGLYGALIVEEAREPFAGDEAVLLLDDVWLDDAGQIEPADAGGPLGDYFGREGNVVLVNGRVLPTVRARPGVPLRLRLVNTAVARYFDLAFPSAALTRIGGDGGLLESPLPLDDLLLVPGERADVVIVPDGAPGDTLTVRSLPFDHGNGSEFTDPVDVFRIALEGAPAPAASPLPERLRVIEPIATEGASPRSLALTEGAKDGDPVLGIDGVPWPDAPPITASVGETQIWTITNETPAGHPFHLHGFHFQVLDVDGAPIGPREWKDTFHVPGKSAARFAVHFDNRPGPWMFHCHILSHARLGMMGMLMLQP